MDSILDSMIFRFWVGLVVFGLWHATLALNIAHPGATKNAQIQPTLRQQNLQLSFSSEQLHELASLSKFFP